MFRFHTRNFFCVPLFGGGFRFVVRTFDIQREKFFENLFIRQIDIEAVSRGDSGVEFRMSVREPRRTLVIEIRERAFR